MNTLLHSSSPAAYRMLVRNYCVEREGKVVCIFYPIKVKFYGDVTPAYFEFRQSIGGHVQRGIPLVGIEPLQIAVI